MNYLCSCSLFLWQDKGPAVCQWWGGKNQNPTLHFCFASACAFVMALQLICVVMTHVKLFNLCFITAKREEYAEFSSSSRELLEYFIHFKQKSQMKSLMVCSVSRSLDRCRLYPRSCVHAGRSFRHRPKPWTEPPMTGRSWPRTRLLWMSG